MVPRYIDIMVFTEDLWFLSGMTTVLLQNVMAKMLHLYMFTIFCQLTIL